MILPYNYYPDIIVGNAYLLAADKCLSSKVSDTSCKDFQYI